MAAVTASCTSRRVARLVDRDGDIGHLADRDAATLALDAAVRLDVDQDRAAVPVLAELQRIRVAGVGVALRVARQVVMAQEGVARSRRRRSPPHRTGRAAASRLLPAQQAALGGVRQGQVDPVAVRPEAGEEAIRVGRRAVRGAPQGEAIGQGQRRQAGLPEEMHVRRPVGHRVRAARRQPVVVAGREHDAAIRAGEARLQEGDGVRRDAVVLEQVAGAQDRVHALRIGQGQDAGQRLATVRPAQPGGLGPRPGKRGVEVQIGKQQ